MKPFQRRKKFGESLPRMYYQRETVRKRHFNLTLECLYLQILICGVPIEVNANFSHRLICTGAQLAVDEALDLQEEEIRVCVAVKQQERQQVFIPDFFTQVKSIGDWLGFVYAVRQL